MANPNNAVGTNGAFGGRTSVNALNDILSTFSGRGILSGWACSPKSGLTVSLGGDGANRDVAIAEDASGNKTTINNISQSPIDVTVNGAPASNSRIDAIVAYIEDSPQGSGETDNPDVVNVLVVSGAVASTPTRPNDSAIRTAITADGASGSTAYYVVLAYVTIPTGTTDISGNMISAGDVVTMGVDKVDFSTLPKMVSVDFGSGREDYTSRTLLSDKQVSGLDTSWEYLVVVCAGLLTETSGNPQAVCFLDLSVPSPLINITPQSRIRGSIYQATISYETTFRPPVSSFQLNLNGSGSTAGLSWENVVVRFIPIQPI